MKVVYLIARLLLGLVFFVFGLNGFLEFIPMGPLPTGLAGQFVGALMQSHYMHFVSALQLIAGLLLLVNRYVPLAVAILAPIIVNIALFHTLMAPAGLPLAIVTSVLWIIVATRVRSVFGGLLEQRVQV
jgi:putative oxidoreductase